MRRILNFFITGLILFVANQLFPNVVQIDSLGTLILAAVLFWLIGIAVVIVCAVIMIVGLFFDNPLWVIVGFVAIFFIHVIALSILSATLSGFAVIGFWPKVLLSLAYSMLALDNPPTSKNGHEY